MNEAKSGGGSYSKYRKYRYYRYYRYYSHYYSSDYKTHPEDKTKEAKK